MIAESTYHPWQNRYGGMKGPEMKVKLVIYGYATGTPSSRNSNRRARAVSDVAVLFL